MAADEQDTGSVVEHLSDDDELPDVIVEETAEEAREASEPYTGGSDRFLATVQAEARVSRRERQSESPSAEGEPRSSLPSESRSSSAGSLARSSVTAGIPSSSQTFGRTAEAGAVSAVASSSAVLSVPLPQQGQQLQPTPQQPQEQQQQLLPNRQLPSRGEADVMTNRYAPLKLLVNDRMAEATMNVQTVTGPRFIRLLVIVVLIVLLGLAVTLIQIALADIAVNDAFEQTNGTSAPTSSPVVRAPTYPPNAVPLLIKSSEVAIFYYFAVRILSCCFVTLACCVYTYVILLKLVSASRAKAKKRSAVTAAAAAAASARSVAIGRSESELTVVTPSTIAPPSFSKECRVRREVQVVVLLMAWCAWLIPDLNPGCVAADLVAFIGALERDDVAFYVDFWPRQRYGAAANSLFVASLFYGLIYFFKWTRLEAIQRERFLKRHTVAPQPTPVPDAARYQLVTGSHRSVESASNLRVHEQQDYNKVRSLRGLIPRVTLLYVSARIALGEAFNFDMGFVPCIAWISVARYCGAGACVAYPETVRAPLIVCFCFWECMLVVWILLEWARARRVLELYYLLEGRASLVSFVTVYHLASIVGFFELLIGIVYVSAVPTQFLLGTDLTQSGVAGVGAVTALTVALWTGVLCYLFLPCDLDVLVVLRKCCCQSWNRCWGGAEAEGSPPGYYIKSFSEFGGSGLHLLSQAQAPALPMPPAAPAPQGDQPVELSGQVAAVLGVDEGAVAFSDASGGIPAPASASAMASGSAHPGSPSSPGPGERQSRALRESASALSSSPPHASPSSAGSSARRLTLGASSPASPSSSLGAGLDLKIPPGSPGPALEAQTPRAAAGSEVDAAELISRVLDPAGGNNIFSFDMAALLWNFSHVTYLAGNSKHPQSDADLMLLVEDARFQLVAQISDEALDSYCAVFESIDMVVVAFRGNGSRIWPQLAAFRPSTLTMLNPYAELLRLDKDLPEAPIPAGSDELSRTASRLTPAKSQHPKSDGWMGTPLICVETEPRVWEDMYVRYMHLHERILDVVDELLQARARPIFLTGHGIGGTLATLCASELSRELNKGAGYGGGWLGSWARGGESSPRSQSPRSQNSPPPEKLSRPGSPRSGGGRSPRSSDADLQRPRPPVSVYTFGAPRCCNAPFAKLYRAQVASHFDIANVSDQLHAMGWWERFRQSVPIPTPLHVSLSRLGSTVLVDSLGNLVIDPDFLEVSIMRKSRRKQFNGHETATYTTGLMMWAQRMYGESCRPLWSSSLHEIKLVACQGLVNGPNSLLPPAKIEAAVGGAVANAAAYAAAATPAASATSARPDAISDNSSSKLRATPPTASRAAATAPPPAPPVDLEAARSVPPELEGQGERERSWQKSVVHAYLATSSVGLTPYLGGACLRVRVLRITGLHAKQSRCVVTCGPQGISSSLWEVGKTPLAALRERSTLAGLNLLRHSSGHGSGSDLEAAAAAAASMLGGGVGVDAEALAAVTARVADFSNGEPMLFGTLQKLRPCATLTIAGVDAAQGAFGTVSLPITKLFPIPQRAAGQPPKRVSLELSGRARREDAGELKVHLEVDSVGAQTLESMCSSDLAIGNASGSFLVSPFEQPTHSAKNMFHPKIRLSPPMATFYLKRNFNRNSHRVVLKVALMRGALRTVDMRLKEPREALQVFCDVRLGAEHARSRGAAQVHEPDWNELFTFGKLETLTGFEDLRVELYASWAPAHHADGAARRSSFDGEPAALSGSPRAQSAAAAGAAAAAAAAVNEAERRWEAWDLAGQSNNYSRPPGFAKAASAVNLGLERSPSEGSVGPGVGGLYGHAPGTTPRNLATLGGSSARDGLSSAGTEAANASSAAVTGQPAGAAAGHLVQPAPQRARSLSRSTTWSGPGVGTPTNNNDVAGVGLARLGREEVTQQLQSRLVGVIQLSLSAIITAFTDSLLTKWVKVEPIAGAHSSKAADQLPGHICLGFELCTELLGTGPLLTGRRTAYIRGTSSLMAAGDVQAAPGEAEAAALSSPSGGGPRSTKSQSVAKSMGLGGANNRRVPSMVRQASGSLRTFITLAASPIGSNFGRVGSGARDGEGGAFDLRARIDSSNSVDDGEWLVPSREVPEEWHIKCLESFDERTFVVRVYINRAEHLDRMLLRALAVETAAAVRAGAASTPAAGAGTAEAAGGRIGAARSSSDPIAPPRAPALAGVTPDLTRVAAAAVSDGGVAGLDSPSPFLDAAGFELTGLDGDRVTVDPYCEVALLDPLNNLAPVQGKRTVIVRDSASPAWEEEFIFGRDKNLPVRGNEILSVAVMQWDITAPARKIGELRVPIGAYLAQHKLGSKASYVASLEVYDKSGNPVPRPAPATAASEAAAQVLPVPPSGDAKIVFAMLVSEFINRKQARNPAQDDWLMTAKSPLL